MRKCKLIKQVLLHIVIKVHNILLIIIDILKRSLLFKKKIKEILISIKTIF